MLSSKWRVWLVTDKLIYAGRFSLLGLDLSNSNRENLSHSTSSLTPHFIQSTPTYKLKDKREVSLTGNLGKLQLSDVNHIILLEGSCNNPKAFTSFNQAIVLENCHLQSLEYSDFNTLSESEAIVTEYTVNYTTAYRITKPTIIVEDTLLDSVKLVNKTLEVYDDLTNNFSDDTFLDIYKTAEYEALLYHNSEVWRYYNGVIECCLFQLPSDSIQLWGRYLYSGESKYDWRLGKLISTLDIGYYTHKDRVYDRNNFYATNTPLNKCKKLVMLSDSYGFYYNTNTVYRTFNSGYNWHQVYKTENSIRKVKVDKIDELTIYEN